MGPGSGISVGFCSASSSLLSPRLPFLHPGKPLLPPPHPSPTMEPLHQLSSAGPEFLPYSAVKAGRRLVTALWACIPPCASTAYLGEGANVFCGIFVTFLDQWKELAAAQGVFRIKPLVLCPSLQECHCQIVMSILNGLRWVYQGTARIIVSTFCFVFS